MKKSQTRQIRRLEKAVDELIKIQDDGQGTERIAHLLDELNWEIAKRDSQND